MMMMMMMIIIIIIIGTLKRIFTHVNSSENEKYRSCTENQNTFLFSETSSPPPHQENRAVYGAKWENMV